MKRRNVFALILCAALITLSALTGCGPASQSSNGGPQADGNAVQSSDKKVKVTHYCIGSDDKNWIGEVMPEFEKQNPNIKMEFLTVPYEEFDTKLTTMVAGGNPPDVTTHYGSGGFIEYYNKGMILELTPYMEKDGYDPVAAGIPQDLMDIYKENGKYYGIPVSSYVSVLFYNKDIFDQAGIPYPTSDYEDKSWTFDKMIEIAKQLTKPSKDVTKAQFGLKFDEWGDRDMKMLYFGGKMYSDDTWTNGGYPSECYYGSTETINAIQRYTDLVYKDKVAPTQAEVQALNASGDPFGTGRIAMYCSGAWTLSFCSGYPFQIGVAAIPYGGNDKVRDVLYVDPLMILKGSKNPDAAFQWIKYLTSKEVQELGIEKGANPPANKLAYDKYFSSIKGVDPEDMRKVVEGGIKYGAEAYNHLVSGSSQIIGIIQNEMGPVENDGEPAERYCKDVQEKVNALLEKLKK